MTDFEKDCLHDIEGIAKTLNTMAENGDMEALDEYFDDVYDIEYRLDGEKRYRSVKLMIACGGPNIYVDTKDAYVRLYWGSTELETPIGYSTAEKIDELFEERFGW